MKVTKLLQHAKSIIIICHSVQRIIRFRFTFFFVEITIKSKFEDSCNIIHTHLHSKPEWGSLLCFRLFLSSVPIFRYFAFSCI